ncbi:MAG: alkaline phosphatase family protein, partial [Candidatus Omnitrophica bacterium]|nr:alkaline phosphatase family protein [Candidatus Omnitrophota bacterium]
EVLKGMDKDAVLIVLSDHGFASFRKSINLNRWLLNNNYLKLKKGKKEGGEFLEDVDWTKTRAYSLGFGGIYLNKIGRESSGIVPESEANALKQEIASGLENIKDPRTAEKAIHNIYFQEDIFQGPYIKEAPDLFVGFSDGFRASWQTALGAAPEALFEDNRKKWSGDHLIDSSIVPGVIFVNRKIKLSNPSIVDILPTILDYYGISRPESLDGKVLFKNEDK